MIYSLDFGDLDGDGDLDLAAATDLTNKIYLNNDGTLETTPSWSSPGSTYTFILSWGDVDGDGDLDLVEGNMGGANIYLNNGGTMSNSPYWSVSPGWVMTVDLGDIEGDGDLDLVIGYYDSRQDQIYLNLDGTGPATTPTWSSFTPASSLSV